MRLAKKTTIQETHTWETHENNYQKLEKIVMKMKAMYTGQAGQGGDPKYWRYTVQRPSVLFLHVLNTD